MLIMVPMSHDEAAVVAKHLFTVVKALGSTDPDFSDAAGEACHDIVTALIAAGFENPLLPPVKPW